VTSVLPALRRTLELLPSPLPDRPGLLVRDPFRYSESIIIVPPALVPALLCFDGTRTEIELRARLVELTGELEVTSLAEHLLRTLSGGGFLEDEAFASRRRDVEGAFARAETRAPVHAGTAYPAQESELRLALTRYATDGEDTPAAVASPPPMAIAAPHVSPEGGWRCYADAYRALDGAPDATYVILGTSHYGVPERFGLTRKPFVTPYGESAIDVDAVDHLAQAAPESAVMEDYCHAVEHSIEFQVVYLQHRFGPGVRIVPVLCGPFARSLYEGGRPEDDPGVARFIDALGDLAVRRGRGLRFVLGVDMAHVGRRYGDRLVARVGEEPLVQVAARDRERLDRVAEGDAAGFWELVVPEADRELKWCGSSPLYTFLRAVPGVRGSVLRYEQWNIDAQSVVSFAALAFDKAHDGSPK